MDKSDTRPMKRRTVITTEKHEIWVIREASNANTEYEPGPSSHAGAADNSLLEHLDAPEAEAPSSPPAQLSTTD